MNNKKGFTLVELLAVVALIGIIMLLVTPNVLNPFKKSKKSLFIDNVKSILNAASTTYLMNPDNGQTFCKGHNKNGYILNINADNLYYSVSVDYDGNVTSILVTDGEYTYSDENTVIKKTDIINDPDKLTEIETDITC